MKALLLDIDGVVCEPQQPMTKEMDHVLRKINGETMEVFFVTGNSYTKAADMIGAKWRIFCNNADELRRQGVLHWQDTETPPLPNIQIELYSFFSKFSSARNNQIEWRSPRFVNVSLLGRYATKQERSNAEQSWKGGLITQLAPFGAMDKLEVVIGGQVSVDIYSKGADKARAGKWLTDHGYEFFFIGDKTDKGGNDYPLVEYCEKTGNKWFKASGVEETKKLIEAL